MKRFYAPHLMVDAECSPIAEKEIKEILLDICNLCQMHPISKPYTVKGADYNPGVSGFVFIEFSNIAIHTFERGKKTGINIDVFSCKEFDKKKILHYLRVKGIKKISHQRRWREIKY